MAGFTVAVLADIHGDAAAFNAVLTDLATQPHQATVLAGDLLLNGPHPLEVLARVRTLGAPAIQGNTEQLLLAARDAPNTDAVTRWVRAQLSEDNLAYLAALPLAHRITPPGGVSPKDDLLIVHATPTDVNAMIITQLPPAGTVLTLTSEPEAVALLGDARANLILHGHIHYASAGTIRGQRLASIRCGRLPIRR
ncbi:MAG: hypothetical protein AVDCRST_MAG88-1246 [uncultured Thermomicrobiales bacterium]|uniref:Calcineurin-like phosphoesterase domain-containing protein n=1 Tax=uncultured Thermomicrobiales bacterium TaxID=1645740 RepID=A0A6J4URG6_9BACT|nr:MAG: hypothetical protein AVDCRST_MAG88-1246 [uncultured Thermomicrobiales bacterium]